MAIVMGYSLGGGVALQVAIRHPEVGFMADPRND
jgi:pimeloyl-ACP methyl ester carboxylesterase